MKLREWLFGRGDRKDDPGRVVAAPESTLRIDSVRYLAETFSELSLSKADLHLLTVVGLPDSAAPFLSFHQEPFMVPGDIEDGLIPIELGHLVEIGSDGGDPICVTKNGSVITLNHDNGFEPIFMNSSVCLLAEFLDAYRVLWAKIGSQRAPNRDKNYVEITLSSVKERLRQLDPEALVPETFRQGALFEIGNQD